jgi:uncharacterized protein YjbI with pentapeptide repeats
MAEKRAWQGLELRSRIALWAAGILAIVLLIGFGLLKAHAIWKRWSFKEPSDQAFTHPNADLAGLIAACVGAAGLAIAALARVRRHEAQIRANQLRRTEKAIELLANDTLEARLHGIYSLERFSQESPDDYWTVMENLTAFVRERTRRTEAEWSWQQRLEQPSVYLESEGPRTETPPADITAALTVIMRRNLKVERKLEREKDLVLELDFSGAVLRGADLRGAHFQGAWLKGASLQGAWLDGAHLEGADLRGARLQRTHLYRAQLAGADLNEAHLEGADLNEAHLDGAVLREAHLEGADLRRTHLNGAVLNKAHLEGADLTGARLERASLLGARGLSQSLIDGALGDAGTQLPSGLARPSHWPTA